MKYIDGNEARVGDIVAIDAKHRGTVVANIDGREFSSECPEAEWSHLQSGILVNTDFAGLVHYPDSEHDNLALVKRK